MALPPGAHIDGSKSCMFSVYELDAVPVHDVIGATYDCGDCGFEDLTERPLGRTACASSNHFFLRKLIDEAVEEFGGILMILAVEVRIRLPSQLLVGADEFGRIDWATSVVLFIEISYKFDEVVFDDAIKKLVSLTDFW